MNLTEASLRRTVEAARGERPGRLGGPLPAGLPAAVRLRPAQARHRRPGRGRRERGHDARAAPISTFAWTAAGIDGWLFGIARNVVLETYRGGSRTTATDPQVLAAHAESRHAVRAPDPAEQVVADEERRMVRLAFDRLTEQDRELLGLRVVVGLGSEAVGVITGRRPGAVRMAQSRALQRLRGSTRGWRDERGRGDRRDGP